MILSGSSDTPSFWLCNKLSLNILKNCDYEVALGGGGRRWYFHTDEFLLIIMFFCMQYYTTNRFLLRIFWLLNDFTLHIALLCAPSSICLRSDF